MNDNDSLAAPTQNPRPNDLPNPTPRTSALAIVSLILGILSLILSVLTALPGLICSIIALVRIGRSNGALGGKGLAIAGLITNISFSIIGIGIMAAMLAGPLMNARSSALHVASMNNMAQIGKACFQYASPSFYDETPASLDNLFQAGLLDNEKVVTNPLTQQKDYIFLPYAKDAPGNQISLVENPGSSDKGLNVLYVDGHVKTLPLPALQEQIAFVRALQQGDRETLAKFREKTGETFFIPGDKKR